MAMTAHVDGPALIQIDAGAGLESLGYTIDGAEIDSEVFTDAVPGDENGGTAGPPIDIQVFGEVHHIHLVFSKWDEAVAAKLKALEAGGTAGQFSNVGSLLYANSSFFRLLINPTSNPINYPRAIIRNKWGINKGSRYSRLVVDLEGHPFQSGVTYNSTNT